MWKIAPLNLGTLDMTMATLISRFGVANDVGRIVPSPLIAWLLTNLEDGRHILVDAGPGPEAERLSAEHNPVSIREDQLLTAALSVHGLKPEDIDTAILTHLHWDHAIGMLYVPNARIYLQKREFLYAVAPLRADHKFYEVCYKDRLPYFLRYYNRLILVDGDTKADEGVALVPLPGHTAGSQGVLVDTPEGKFLLPGDIVNTSENLETGIPGGVFNNTADVWASMEKIQQMIEKEGVTVLPAHDSNVFRKEGRLMSP
ncbi:MAG: N-acyl homoserine lactonase family protein [Gracilibacteraceae bacterium]|jgi:glyoxylase-like metal-dependent hydrolase (beta-lactamase superfamily II)|nr:N-acyl homoserine lactonase family protein [Gracilibacteraceae bacterium]